MSKVTFKLESIFLGYILHHDDFCNFSVKGYSSTKGSVAGAEGGKWIGVQWILLWVGNFGGYLLGSVEEKFR